MKAILIYIIIFPSLFFTNTDKQRINSTFKFDETQLQNGDIILRSGRGFLSEVFRSMSDKEKKYSHAGIIFFINKNPFVCHYIDADSIDFKVEPLNIFASSYQCSAFAVYRYNLSAKMQCIIVNEIHKNILHPLPFDNRFDLRTDDSMYCTEWVCKCLSKSGIKIPYTNHAGFKYLSADNLYINTACKKINDYEYRN
jgi:hypothetical protein